MIPPFKFYFYPFLNILYQKGCCRLYDLSNYIANFLKLTREDRQELTKSGKVKKHTSRVNYCASYLKRMKLVESVSAGAYIITKRGEEVLKEYGAKMTLSDLRNLPEYIATQINATNDDFVYVKPHIRGGKKISAYVCNKKSLKAKNPNIEHNLTASFRKQISVEKKD